MKVVNIETKQSLLCASSNENPYWSSCWEESEEGYRKMKISNKQKPSMKGGHRHRRNWWICPICNKIFKQPWIQNPNIIGELTNKVVQHMETAHQMPF